MNFLSLAFLTYRIRADFLGGLQSWAIWSTHYRTLFILLVIKSVIVNIQPLDEAFHLPVPLCSHQKATAPHVVACL